MDSSKVLEISSKTLCVGVFIFQAVLTNIFLAKLYSTSWWSWIIAHGAVLITWFVCLKVARRKSIAKHNDSPNEIKYAFIGWLSYMCFLCPRIVLLFHEHAKSLSEEEVLGPNFLKMALSCTPLIFFLLIHGAHSNVSKLPRHMSVSGLAIAGALDLFDSIDLLEFLFLPEDNVYCPKGYLHATLAFACISMFMPLLSLYALQVKTTPGRVSSLAFKIAYEFLNIGLINLPNLVIRSVLWHKYNMDVSVLIMKNVMCIAGSTYEIIEYFGEFRPVACKRCSSWFDKHMYKDHKESCNESSEENVALDTVPLSASVPLAV